MLCQITTNDALFSLPGIIDLIPRLFNFTNLVHPYCQFSIFLAINLKSEQKGWSYQWDQFPLIRPSLSDYLKGFPYHGYNSSDYHFQSTDRRVRLRKGLLCDTYTIWLEMYRRGDRWRHCRAKQIVKRLPCSMRAHQMGQWLENPATHSMIRG